MKKGDAVVIADLWGNPTRTTVTSAGKKWITADGRRFAAETRNADIGGCTIFTPAEYLLKTHTVAVWKLLYDLFGPHSGRVSDHVCCKVLQVLVDVEELKLTASVKESMLFLIEQEKQK